MKIRRPFALILALGAAACGGAGSALEYGVPTPSDVRYAYADTSSVAISIMGQNLEMSQRGTAEYAVSFAAAPSGVNVSMSITELSGTISQPMGAPIRIDEGDVEGALVFALDRYGNAVVAEQPRVDVNASQMISGLSIAHNFFPGLPGRAASMGDSWVDTVSYEGTEGAGAQAETAIMRYAVQGDTAVGGRTLTKIAVEGTSESSAEMEVSGMTVTQRSVVDVEGYVLWDPATGLMVERYSVATGEGTAGVPIAPSPIPIQIRSTQWVRLQDR